MPRVCFRSTLDPCLYDYRFLDRGDALEYQVLRLSQSFGYRTPRRRGGCKYMRLVTINMRMQQVSFYLPIHQCESTIIHRNVSWITPSSYPHLALPQPHITNLRLSMAITSAQWNKRPRPSNHQRVKSNGPTSRRLASPTSHIRHRSPPEHHRHSARSHHRASFKGPDSERHQHHTRNHGS